MKKSEESLIKCIYDSDDSDLPIKIIIHSNTNKKEEEEIYINTYILLSEDNILKTYLFKNEEKEEQIAVKSFKKAKFKYKNTFLENIEIQKSINRPDFSKFINSFEDDNNIFIIEYYNDNSLVSLVRLYKSFKFNNNI